MKRNIVGAWLLVFVFALYSFGQAPQVLKTDGPNTFILTKDASKEFTLNLKRGDYVELEWDNKLQAGYWPVLSLLSPAGQELFEGDNMAVIVPTGGEHKVVVTLKGSEEAKPYVGQTLNLLYNNALKIPADTIVRETRKINGYEIKIIVPKNTDEGGESIFLIEKAGKPKAILKGDSYGTLGFNFADKGGEADETSAKLFAATADKTGDGTPDVAVEYFSGGAHCCFEMHFFELGEDVVKIPVLSTGDAPIRAVEKNPKGGLYLGTADAVFAYWNIPFAGSPFGDLVLEFRNGKWRPSPAKMLRPAPSMVELEKRAAEERSKINNTPYLGSSFAGLTEDGSYVFEDAFWGTMLDLIYTGHRDLAWKYLDMVWPETKKGKDIFKADFQENLENSRFWEDIKTLNAAKP